MRRARASNDVWCGGHQICIEENLNDCESETSRRAKKDEPGKTNENYNPIIREIYVHLMNERCQKVDSGTFRSINGLLTHPLWSEATAQENYGQMRRSDGTIRKRVDRIIIDSNDALIYVTVTINFNYEAPSAPASNEFSYCLASARNETTHIMSAANNEYTIDFKTFNIQYKLLTTYLIAITDLAHILRYLWRYL